MALCRACAKKTYIPIVNVSYALSLKSASRFSTSVPSPSRRTRAAFATVATAAIRYREARGEITDEARPRTGGNGDPQSRGPPSPEWVVRKHLQYLSNDPFKIAQHVRATISRGRFEEALLLTRQASKNTNLTVSWNHLIDHLMHEQRLHAALKLYNEMKKRAQQPNAQTYTIIFNGCADSKHPKLAVAEALRLYHTMLSSDRLQPNIMHLNAVLKVCSRAEDLESLFSLLQTANDSRSPNSLTYTTILNALRLKQPPFSQRAEQDADGMTAAERKDAYLARAKVSIQRAQSVWDEVVERWRQGKVVIDEDLVCAMGRVLLTGDSKANDEVLSLIEQAMNIPRIDAKPDPEQKPLLGGKEAQSGTVAPRRRQRAVQTHAQPGTNSLSMVLESLGATRKTTLAPRYWDVFVGQNGVVPDSDNWFRLLRTLHIGKASTKASEYLASMPPQFVRPETLRLVMRTCVGDNLNEHAFENADKVLEVAMRVWTKPDPETLRTYLHAATANHHRFGRMYEQGDQSGSTAALGKQLVHALERLWDPMRLATNKFKIPDVGEYPPTGLDASRYNDLRELAAVARRMTAVIDKIVIDKMVEPAEMDTLKRRRITLDRYITSLYEQRGMREPALESSQDRRRSSRPGRPGREGADSGRRRNYGMQS